MYRKNLLKTNKNKFWVLILILFICLSIGYAAISRTLSITGNSEVRQNTWDIHFENIQITDGSVEATTSPTTSEGTTSINFSFNLDLPGDFYEFMVDVWNRGTIDAMLESVIKTPELTETQAKYLNYAITYQNKEPIEPKQLVKSNEFVRYKVRVEYRSDLNPNDLPSTPETLNLGLTVNYVQSDNTGVIVPGKSLFKVVSGDGTNTGDEICIGEECFYVMYSDTDTITMLSKYNLYVGNECTSSESSTCIPYGEEATGKQDKNMIGAGQTPRKGTIKFSDKNYWSSTINSYPAYVYNENSLHYSYVENYKKYLSSLGVTPIEARLITYEELEGLGCDTSNTTCKSAPNWVYTTSYLSGSAASSINIWFVYSTDVFLGGNYYYFSNYGCRPVIVIDKSLL